MLNMIISIAKKVFKESEEESRQFLNSRQSEKFDYDVLIICVTTALSLTIINYWSSYSSSVFFVKHYVNYQWAFYLSNIFTNGKYAQLFRLTHWVLVLSICYFIIPLIVIKFALKSKIKNYGLSLENSLKDYKLYLVMLLIMIPVVFIMSYFNSFQKSYPFYKLEYNESINTKFVIWELEYFFQFFILEFFFRGFILHGVKHRFGYYSVFVMLIPYCMIHFGKPIPETISAILAAIILGTLSLKSRNILLGFFIHCSVAFCMDFFSLWQKGLLIF
jgi:hypothetical protein